MFFVISASADAGQDFQRRFSSEIFILEPKITLEMEETKIQSPSTSADVASGELHRSRIERLFFQAARELNSTMEYEDLIELSLRLSCQAVECEAAFMFRYDGARRSRRARLYIAGDSGLKVLRKEIGSGISGWVAENGISVIANDPTTDERFDQVFASQMGIQVRNLMALPLISRGRPLGVLEVINRRNGDFTEADRDTLFGLSDQIAISIDNSLLLRDARRRAKELERLSEVTSKLSGALRLEEALTIIMDSVSDLAPFDAGGIFLIDQKKREFGRVYARGYPPESEKSLHGKIDQGLIGWVATNPETIIVPDVSKDDRYCSARPETRSEIVAPLMLNKQVIGVFNLESNELEAYDRHSAALLQAFGAQAAVAIERTTLHDEIVLSRRIDEQLEIAREIQRTFLPYKDPVIAGYDISGVNYSSGDVGGDYYDFINIVDKQTGITIADVSGKGIPASLIMASFRASLIAEIRNNYAIRIICQKVNSLMHESVEPGNYVTAVYYVLDSRNHIMTYCNAGHDHPILLRANGEVTYLHEGGAPFGIMETQNFEERPIFLSPNDMALFYTDGVTEARAHSGEQFGLERLVKLVRETRALPARDIHRKIYEAVQAFASKDHLFDDLTMVVLKRLA